MALDFPANPTNGQTFGNYIYDTTIPGWRNVNSGEGVGLQFKSGLIPITPTSISVGSGSASVNSSGLVAFSGATSISLNGVFGASYKNYKMMLVIKGTTNDSLAFRLRTGTSDSASNNYSFGGWAVSRAAATGTPSGADISWAYLGGVHSSGYHGGREVNLFNPYDTSWWTNYTSLGSDSTQLGLNVVAGMFTQTTQFDGMSVFTFSGNLTGSVQIYGYN